MTTYEPEVVSGWSDQDLKALLGKRVTVELAYGSGITGVVYMASLNEHGARFISLNDGLSIEWYWGEDAWITVYDEA